MFSFSVAMAADQLTALKGSREMYSSESTQFPRSSSWMRRYLGEGGGGGRGRGGGKGVESREGE